MQRRISKPDGTIMNQRILYLDLLRIIACVMIVFMHSQRPGMGGACLVPERIIIHYRCGLCYKPVCMDCWQDTRWNVGCRTMIAQVSLSNFL